MGLPYETRIKFILEGTGEELFLINGLNTNPYQDDIIYLDGVKYKVEGTELYLESNTFQAPSGKPDYSISKVELVVTVSLI